MTNVSGFLVVLKYDMDTDAAEALRAAIEQFQGVDCVVPQPADPADFIAEERAYQAIRARMFSALFKEYGNPRRDR